MRGILHQRLKRKLRKREHKKGLNGKVSGSGASRRRRETFLQTRVYMHFEVLSLFPSYIDGPIQESILKRAIQKGFIQVSTVDIRSFATRKDGRVDDRPYGGGPGMVMMAEPVVSAIRSCKKPSSRVVFLSPRGVLLTPSLARDLSKEDHLVLVCGHYEGVDERAVESCVDLEVSIGDYVLTNGCLAALVLIDTISRFIPGVLGHEESSSSDSFENGLFKWPQYTVPRVFEGEEVPEVLFSGDHKKIASWRQGEALRLTREKRPDLVAKAFNAQGSKKEGVTLRKIVEEAFYFEKTCEFYHKLTGVSPETNEGRASFFWEGITLSFMRTNLETKKQSTLYLELTPAQFKKAFLWWTKKNPAAQHNILSNNAFLCTDPDGRNVVVTSTS